MAKTKDRSLSIRVSAEQKSLLADRSKKAGLSVSEYILTAALSEDKILVLEDGKKIASSLHKLLISDNALLTQLASELMSNIRSLTSRLQALSGGD